MNRIEAVLFDLDGTLVNSHKIVVELFKTTLDFYNIHLSNEEIAPKIVHTLEGSYQAMVQGEDINKFCLKHGELNGELIPKIETFSGVYEVLNEFEKSKIELAVVTARTRWAEEILQSTGLKGIFKKVVTGSDVTNNKPDPEGIYKVLGELGIRKTNAIMVGDTAPDIGAGKNAGIETVGVTYGFYGKKVIECNPDYVINNFIELREIVIRK